jgi:hydroxyacylglutathione hydrolase
MNKKSVSLFALLICMGSVLKAQPVFKNAELEISLIEDKVWVIETVDNNTMYVIDGDEKALLIDTGTKYEKLDEVIKQVITKPIYVVLTHAHADHAGNIGFFSEIYMHPADTGILDIPYGGKIHFVDDGFAFELGNRVVEVKHMPAHTPGSIVLLDRKTGSCFSGDAFGSGQVWLQLRPVAPMKTYLNSLEKMEAIMDSGISKIYCGHYPYVKKSFDRKYIDSMHELAKALNDGKDIGAQPYPIKVSIGCDNPMIVTKDNASIVFDPDHLK